MNSTKTITKEQTDAIVRQTTAVGIIGNVALSAFKLFAGIFGHSAAMISDAIHSSSDVMATLIAYVGMRLSKKSADSNHPYGHERLECIASVLLSAILLAAGAEIGLSCIRAIATRSYLTAARPGLLALAAALVSIVSKEAMFWYTLHNANRIHSGVFKADAWHHRSDALSSVGALAGIGAARLGYPIMDSVAGLIISMVILFVAFGICKDAVNKMVDTSAGPDYEKQVRSEICAYSAQKGVAIGIDSLITRKFGEKVYVDTEISVDGDMKLKDAHDIAENVHKTIEERFPDVKHVMVHLNPAGYQYTVRS